MIRVFPRKMPQMPTDEMAFVGSPPLPNFIPDADEVHVSCTFTWDKHKCERLANDWKMLFRVVKVGGPAYDCSPGDFTPGMYLKDGYTITSRGCIHKCSFCLVHAREGELRELPICDGWKIQDNNILACSHVHHEKLFAMLARQTNRPEFTGGLENRLLTPWFCGQMREVSTQHMYLAFDTEGQSKSLSVAAKMLHASGFRHSDIGCFCLIGQEGDTIKKADMRMRWAFRQGVIPFAMFFRPITEKRWRIIPPEWRKLCNKWSSPVVVFGRMGKQITRAATI